LRLPCTVLLLLAACATPRGTRPATCPTTPASPLLGCFRVVEATPALARIGIQPDSVLLLQEKEVSVFQNETTWARLTVEWNLPGEPHRLEGRVDRNWVILHALGPDRVGILEAGEEIGVAARLAPGEPRLAQLLALPSLAALEQRTRDCLKEYAALLPGDLLPSQAPSFFRNTAGALDILGLARLNLLKQCQPVPERCAFSPMSPELAMEVAELERACAQ
jgi:hypothetical protein